MAELTDMVLIDVSLLGCSVVSFQNGLEWWKKHCTYNTMGNSEKWSEPVRGSELPHSECCLVLQTRQQNVLSFNSSRGCLLLSPWSLPVSLCSARGDWGEFRTQNEGHENIIFRPLKTPSTRLSVIFRPFKCPAPKSSHQSMARGSDWSHWSCQRIIPPTNPTVCTA